MVRHVILGEMMKSKNIIIIKDDNHPYDFISITKKRKKIIFNVGLDGVSNEFKLDVIKMIEFLQ